MDSYDNNVRLLPLQVRTAYAEALERLIHVHLHNQAATLGSVSLMTKTFRGKDYLYAQGRIADGSAKQIYLGPINNQVRAAQKRFQERKGEAAREWDEIKSFGKMLRSAGLPSLDPIEYRVLSALAADGIFRVDGVLVGTIAYRCLIGSLGAKTKSTLAMTADIDIAGRTIPVAMTREQAFPETALERLDLGFSPMMEADANLYGSRLKANKVDFKVEFLTPLLGKDPDKPIMIRQLNVPAIPLRYLDFLIEEPIYAIAFGRQPILVRVPSPQRYAVHKLIVSQERKDSPLKSQKDLEQAFDLQSVLLRLDPEALQEAFDSARTRGPKWKKRIDAGYEAMIRLYGNLPG